MDTKVFMMGLLVVGTNVYGSQSNCDDSWGIFMPGMEVMKTTRTVPIPTPSGDASHSRGSPPCNEAPIKNYLNEMRKRFPNYEFPGQKLPQTKPGEDLSQPLGRK